MTKTPGTTLNDPVGKDQRPDLKSGLHEINEYFASQGAYDLCDRLVKELLTAQPPDPLQHMLKYLEAEQSSNLLKVIVRSAPGAGRSDLARRLAQHFGLVYIGAGELLRESGTDTTRIGYADDKQVAELVMPRILQATENMQGWVLDGYPRTRVQTSFLKEQSIVPTHVLILQISYEEIRERRQRIEDGELDGELLPLEALEQKLKFHGCHSSSALETYGGKISVIKPSKVEGVTWMEMERAVRMVPRSRGPQPPPRVVILGPHGLGVKAHASRLAARLGAVYMDGAELLGLNSQKTSQAQKRNTRISITAMSSMAQSFTSTDVVDLDQRAAGDLLGRVGVRVREPDCASQGWVMCGFPATQEMAQRLAGDSHLAPTRVVALNAPAETCAQRLRHIYYDAVTGKVWTSLPRNEHIRKRLQRKPEDHHDAVVAQHTEYNASLPGILRALGTDGRCLEVRADGPPAAVHSAIVEFVERPLPLRS